MELISWFSEHPQIIANLGTAVGGYIVAMVISYIKFGQDLSFIKGQLQSILDLHVAVKDLQTKHGTMEKDIVQNIRDIQRASSRIKVVETQLFNRSIQ